MPLTRYSTCWLFTATHSLRGIICLPRYRLLLHPDFAQASQGHGKHGRILNSIHTYHHKTCHRDCTHGIWSRHHRDFRYALSLEFWDCSRCFKVGIHHCFLPWDDILPCYFPQLLSQLQVTVSPLLTVSSLQERSSPTRDTSVPIHLSLQHCKSLTGIHTCYGAISFSWRKGSHCASCGPNPYSLNGPCTFNPTLTVQFKSSNMLFETLFHYMCGYLFICVPSFTGTTIRLMYAVTHVD